METTRKTLVTGGRGFIGVNLVPSLATENPVRVLDNLSRSSPTGAGDGSADFRQGDITNSADLESAFSGVNAVVHLAAYGSVIESIIDPAENFEINARGTLNVLQAAARAGVRRLVFSSTGGALIGDATPPVNEQSVPRPISPYGASKLCGEGYCNAFASSFGLDTIILRFGNVYGPHSAHKRGAVTVFIKALLTGDPIVIYGDGSATRDYIHVDDICAGIRIALAAPAQDGGVFHLASGRETTIMDLAKILRDVAGKPNHPIELRPARRGEVTRNFADYGKARAAFGFEPRWKIEEGLAATWQWFVDHADAALSATTTDS